MYCRSELHVCIIAAPKYILPLRNMLSRRHAHVKQNITMQYNMGTDPRTGP